MVNEKIPSLENCFKKMYDSAIEDIHQHIKAKGYISYGDVHYCLQKYISRFETSYLERLKRDYGMDDPFTDEFTNLIFDDFTTVVKTISGLRTKILTEDERDDYGFQEVYAFNDDEIEKARKNFKKARIKNA